MARCRFVVATKNSARWFGKILDRYGILGVSPFVMLDRASEDGTEKMLQERNIDYAEVFADSPRVESLVKLIPTLVHADWVFRLDDDELPSRDLFRWLHARLLYGSDKDVIGFQRRWIRLTADGRCEYSRHPLIQSPLGGIDIQWRLFRPTAVRFRSDIHTPGFHVPAGAPVAPPGAYIAHFNWLVRSANERRLQGEDYDDQEPNAGARFRDIKVWEDSDVARHQFQLMETDEFDELAAALAGTIGYQRTTAASSR